MEFISSGWSDRLEPCLHFLKHTTRSRSRFGLLLHDRKAFVIGFDDTQIGNNNALVLLLRGRMQSARSNTECLQQKNNGQSTAENEKALLNCHPNTSLTRNTQSPKNGPISSCQTKQSNRGGITLNGLIGGSRGSRDVQITRPEEIHHIDEKELVLRVTRSHHRLLEEEQK